MHICNYANSGLSSTDAAFRSQAQGSAALPEDNLFQEPWGGLDHSLGTLWISVGVTEIGFEWPLPFTQLM